MEFQSLGAKERALLLRALEFDKDNLHCQLCGDKVNYETCCIMPSVYTEKQATILCGCALCTVRYLEYFDEVEKNEETRSG